MSKHELSTIGQMIQKHFPAASLQQIEKLELELLEEKTAMFNRLSSASGVGIIAQQTKIEAAALADRAAHLMRAR